MRFYKSSLASVGGVGPRHKWARRPISRPAGRIGNVLDTSTHRLEGYF